MWLTERTVNHLKILQSTPWPVCFSKWPSRPTYSHTCPSRVNHPLFMATLSLKIPKLVTLSSLIFNPQITSKFLITSHDLYQLDLLRLLLGQLIVRCPSRPLHYSLFYFVFSLSLKPPLSTIIQLCHLKPKATIINQLCHLKPPSKPISAT